MAGGKIVILSGPSGVGKDTVIAAWSQVNPSVVRVVAATTRAPREGERQGVDYHFLTPEAFGEMAACGEFLEYKEVHGRCYGTPKKHVEDLAAQGKTAVLKIDVQGALEVMGKVRGAVSVFLLPPTWKELERRIFGRGTESLEAAALRLQNARDEVDLAHRYQHQVVNQDVSACVARLEAILRG